MTDVGNLRARYRRIMRFATRYLVQTWWYELVLPRFGLTRIAARTRSRRVQRIARNFNSLAVDLGGLMIKVGQFMSSRLDVLPREITKELEGLQDEVPAIPFEQIRVHAEAELGVSFDRAFSFVDPVPLAAASLGQVHRARLAAVDASETGLTDVVLKIQRPGIELIVDVDLKALRRVAGILSRVRLVSNRVDMPMLMEEFAQTSLEEIDYLAEATNAERFTQNFAGDARVRVPEFVWERTTRRVLTMQDVTAIKITDVESLRAAGIDTVEVAAEFASVMFDQLFVHGFFHGDPHPGNVFVTPLDASESGGRSWAFTFIDFGMMGEVPDALRRGLRQVVIAAASRDGKGMVDGIREVGVLLPTADTAELERAMTTAFARFGGMGFAELQEVDPRQFQAFALEFSDLVRSLPFQFPENFLLIVRALSVTSGVCSSINPAFNIWDAVEPYSALLIRSEGGNLVQEAAKRLTSSVGIISRLPQRLDDLTTRLNEGRISVQSPRLERRLADLERLGRRVISAILFTALLIGGILLRPTDVALGTVLMSVSTLPLLHVIFAGVVARRGPLP
ncbi:MAG: AarF/ABC1/UbiB kinase family protein [Salinibacterium sp.]|nr:AarF/ABC1/UbiB kinase family protein [Salinibacterium sp.]